MKKFKLLSAFTNCLMIFGSCHMKAIKDELIDNNIENIFVAYDTSLQNILVYCRISKTADKIST